MINDWVLQLRNVPNAHFAHLIRAHGISTMDAARLAKEALSSFGSAPRGRGFERWEDAWNHLTGSDDGRPGKLLIRNPQCLTCNGRGVATQGSALSRAASKGYPMGVCPDCRGTRVGTSITLTTLKA